jgi:LysM repeat protein
MKFIKYFIYVVFLTNISFSQKTHVVQKGETLNGLANKYGIKAEDFIKLNPSLKDGLKADATLVLPPNAKKIAVKTKTESKPKISYKVKSGDTMLGLENKFKTTTAELLKDNPELSNGLKADQTITVYTNIKIIETKTTEPTKPQKPKTYIVLPKDTKYGVANKFDLTVDELEKLNPHIKNEFEIGTEIRLVKDAPLNTIAPVKNIISAEKLISHEVEAGETLYSISQKYKVDIEAINKKNPSLLTDGLKEGSVILIPHATISVVKNDSIISIKKRVNLLETVNKNKARNLVLLMPFNINKIENDASKTKAEYLKSDKFLNITLDFYQGALIAIDSAKTLGLPINVKVFDAETSKTNSNVANIISNNNFSDVDAVLGPFGNNFVESVGQMLENKNIPVISPLSREETNGGKNVYYAMPSEDIQRNNLITFLEKNSENILAIVQSNKTASKELIAKMSNKIKFIGFTDKGVLDIPALTANLKKGTKNFVILEADKTTVILNVVNSLNKLKKEYDIQLVVFERTDAIEYDEIPTKSLASLKMLFPTALRENDTPEAQIFANKFKSANKVFPNQYATRGFDVTFDVILRMCQTDGFAKSTETMVSEQIESQFYYNSKNTNIGVYMMYYNPDLTIKKAQ